MRAENHMPAREPLDAAGLRRAALRPDGLWREIEVVPSTGSTNADLLARALAGQPEGVLLAAEEQTAGRGRMGRTWTSPPYAALTFSLLLHPAVPPARRGWLPLLAGVAVAAAVTEVTGVEARLKWPNDVLADDVLGGEGKLAGILAEAAGDAVVVGIGLNVSTEPAELSQLPAGPGPGALPATSLHAAGATVLSREKLLLAILSWFERWYQAWRQAGGDPDRSGLRAEYTRLSATIGRPVRAELPGGQALSGPAVGVDSDGRLLVRVPPGSEVPVAAADVVHLR
jgi:BirA family biotin operon repressor/biotin-[acetyl-CoA-carboxylase] ligase